MTKYLIMFSIVGTQGSEKWLLSDKEATFFNIENYFGAGDVAEWLSTCLACVMPWIASPTLKKEYTSFLNTIWYKLINFHFNSVFSFHPGI